MSTPPLVLVVWEDAKVIDDDTWTQHKDEAPEYKPFLVSQVGYLMSDTEDGLIITHAWNPVLCSQREQIPRGMVREVVFLEPAKPRRKRS